MKDFQTLSQEFEDCLLSLDRVGAKGLFEGIKRPNAPLQLVDQLVVPVLERIGSGWEEGKVALSQVYMSGTICEELVDLILPPSDPSRIGSAQIAIVVLEDYHLLGKRIVYSVLRAAGYQLKDYGQMNAEELVKRTWDDKIEILLISTLMLPSALKVKVVRENLDKLEKLEKTKPHSGDNPGPHSNIKIIVGGAPFFFDTELYKEVGADAMGRSASDVPAIVSSLMKNKKGKNGGTQ